MLWLAPLVTRVRAGSNSHPNCPPPNFVSNSKPSDKDAANRFALHVDGPTRYYQLRSYEKGAFPDSDGLREIVFKYLADLRQTPWEIWEYRKTKHTFLGKVIFLPLFSQERR